MKKHHLRKIVCLLLALLIIGSTLSATAFAAAGDTLDSLSGVTLKEDSPSPFQFLRNNTEGTVTKEINEIGFYQRLPRNTQTCPRCGGVLVELTPDYFAVPSAGSYVLSDPSVLGDCSFSLEYSKFSGYTTSPCLQFNYTAKRPGTTTVTLTFYYNYNYSSEIGNCSFCGQRVQTASQTTWYQETTTFTVTVSGEMYTVTYTDGVDGEEIFPDQSYTGLLSGDATPEFVGTPTRENYIFAGWNPAVAATVTGDATYTAVWKEDRNNNGIPDEDEDKYTVTYTDGVDGEEIFPDQVYTDLLFGDATPDFAGTPTRENYIFAGWNPAVAATVTGDATYTAVWKEDRNNNGTPDDEEDKYTVTYTDGVDGEEIFPDQVYTDLLFGDAMPEFVGTPTREGYVFVGWSPEVAETVTGDVNYVPVWEKVSSENPEEPTVPETPVTPPDTGDSSMLWIPIVLLAAAFASTALFKKKSI